ncbi:unnamed protein product [Moritella viscosa]|nr:unnamed protein product [Moritella viscosa]
MFIILISASILSAVSFAHSFSINIFKNVIYILMTILLVLNP